MAHPLFSPEVRLMLLDNNPLAMKAFVETLHPRTVAETLAEDEFTVEQIWLVLAQAESPAQAKVFEYLPMEWQIRLAEGAGRPQMAKLIEVMSHDDRVALLRKIPRETSDAIIRLIDDANRRDIATLFRYDEGTVGALMTTDYSWLPILLTAGQALERLRQQAPDRETIYYIYLLDEPTRRLLGIVTLRSLVLAAPSTPLRDLMESTELISLKATDDREKAAALLAKYDFLAIPVVDDDARLVGIVTHDDAIDVLTEEATEDLQKQAAVGPLAGNYLDTNFFVIWRKRAFWLSILFIAQLITFTVMAEFEEALATILVLALFVPLCISCGGNSGSQSATLITRSLALGHVRISEWWRVLKHELLMGIVLGITIGCMGLLRGAATSDDLRSSKKEFNASFEIVLPAGESLAQVGNQYVVPTGTTLAAQEPLKRKTTIELPSNMEPTRTVRENEVVYSFPKGSITRSEAVGRWRFAWVIAQAVAFVCLWGTIVGAMLPIIFMRINIDPALASSPFVATFVDVTGIFAYFSIATLYLL